MSRTALLRTLPLVGLLLAVASAAPVGAQLQATAVRTIFLDTPTSFSNASSVTYHPGFAQYYGSETGSTTGRNAYVFGSTGGPPIQTLDPLNIDARAWNYNANTGLLEVSSFNAAGGGAGQGIIEAQVNGSGLLTGGTSTLLAAPVAGLAGSQTAPAYDPAADVLYSRDNSNTVNVVSRATGALSGTITLDFAAAGSPTVPDDGIVFVPERQWLGVLDETADAFAFFDLTGAFIGTSALDIDATSGNSRRPGYTNGQLFVYDGARGGWQGYNVLALQATDVPALGPTGLALFALLLALGAAAVLKKAL